MIDPQTVNSIAPVWAGWILARTVDSTLVFLIASALWLLLRNRVSSHVGYILFLLVLVKLLFPIQFACPNIGKWNLDSVSYFSSLPFSFLLHEGENAATQKEKSFPSDWKESVSLTKRDLSNERAYCDQCNSVKKSNKDSSHIVSAGTVSKDKRNVSKEKIAIGGITRKEEPSLFDTIGSIQKNNRNTTIDEIVQSHDNNKSVSEFKNDENRIREEMRIASLLKEEEANPNPLSSLSIVSLIMLLWGIITILLFGRFVCQEYCTHKRIHQSEILDPDQIPVDFKGLLSIANVKRHVRLATNSWIQSPFVYGIFTPCLFIPRTLFTSNSTNQIRWILLHELAHIRRWDTAVRLLQKVCQYLFFFHPAVWLTNKCVDMQREFSCDDSAVLGTNAAPSECGKGLMGIILQVNREPFWMPSSIGMFNSKTIIKERLMRILNPNRTLCSGLSLHAGIALAALALIVIPFSTIASTGKAQEETNDGAFIVSAPNHAEPAETVSVASTTQSSASVVQSSASAAAEKTTGSRTICSFPTDDFTIVKENRYVWKRSLSFQFGKVKSVEFKTFDGDIQIKAQPDPNIKNVEVDADLIIQKKPEVDESEVLKYKEQFDLVIESSDKEKAAAVVHRPKQTPKGLSATANLYVKFPAGLDLTANTGDGDICVDGCDCKMSLNSKDGDIISKNCVGPTSANTMDGDILIENTEENIQAGTKDGDVIIKNCPGPIHADSKDGDINIVNSENPIHAETKDGDVIMKNCPGPIQAGTKDGDIHIVNAKEKIQAETNDGEIILVFDATPADGCVIEAKEGEINIDLPDDANVNVALKTHDGSIHVPESRFSGVKKEKEVVGKLNDGGVSIVANTKEGDITIR